MDGNTLLIMSLVKLHREDWAKKKSTKRLRVLLKKCRQNYLGLQSIVRSLKSFDLPVDRSIVVAYEKYLLDSAKLDNIIYRRENPNSSILRIKEL